MELTEIEMLKNRIAYLESRPVQLEEEALKVAKQKQINDELSEKIYHANKYIESFDRQAEEKNKEISALKSQLTESRPAGHLNRYLESESMIERLQKEIIQQKAFLRSATDQIQKLDKKIAQKNEEIHSLSEQLNECTLDQNRSMPGKPMNLVKCQESKEFQIELSRDIDEIYSMLVEKNASYGNSALDPIRVFSKADSMEQILVRIDDKLSRIKRGSSYPGDNDVKDLIGYFFLFLQAERKAKQVSEEPE